MMCYKENKYSCLMKNILDIVKIINVHICGTQMHACVKLELCNTLISEVRHECATRQKN